MAAGSPPLIQHVAEMYCFNLYMKASDLTITFKLPKSINSVSGSRVLRWQLPEMAGREQAPWEGGAEGGRYGGHLAAVGAHRDNSGGGRRQQLVQVCHGQAGQQKLWPLLTAGGVQDCSELIRIYHQLGNT